MKLNNLIPKDKFDTETAGQLPGYSFEAIQPILPQLLEWLQDGNWPVSRPVAAYLRTLPQDQLGPYLMNIMQGDDYEWKYFLISAFSSIDPKDLYLPYLQEIRRLAEHPTPTEINCELQYMARLILDLDQDE